jgi:hypothetical protein
VRRPSSAGSAASSTRTDQTTSRASTRGTSQSATMWANPAAGSSKARDKNGMGKTAAAAGPVQVDSVQQYLDVFDPKCPPEFAPASTWAQPAPSQAWLAKHGLAAVGMMQVVHECPAGFCSVLLPP